MNIRSVFPLVLLSLFFASAQANNSGFATCQVDGSQLESDLNLTTTFGGEDVTGMIELLEFSHQMSNTQGVQSFQSFKFTKRIDKTTPHWYQALITAQQIDCDITFFRPTTQGIHESYHFLELRKGKVSSIVHDHPNTKMPASAVLPSSETIGISFLEMSWTFLPDGSVATSR